MIEQHKSLSEKFLKKGFWLYLFSFIIAPIGYFIKIIISGELSVSEVGILYGVLSLVTLVSAYSDFGVKESLKYFIPKYITDNDYNKVKTILTYSAIVQLITGGSIMFLFIFFSSDIAISYFNDPKAKETIIIFAYFFIAINIFQIIENFLMAIQNTFMNRLIMFIRMLGLLLSVLYFFYFEKGNLINYSMSWIIGLYLGIIYGIYIFFSRYYLIFLSKSKILWDKNIFKEIFSYSVISFLGLQATTILSQIDMQMVIYLLGTVEAGYYTIYLSIIGIAFIVITPLIGLIMPIFSELYQKKEFNKIKDTKNKLNNLFLIIGILISFFFFFFSKEITFILFGNKFLQSSEILMFSILFITFNILIQINFNIMSGIGKISNRLKIVIIAIILNFFTNLIFIKYLGLGSNGAALSTGIGWMLIWIMTEFSLGKEYYTKLNLGNIITNIVIIGISTYILKYLYPYLELSLGRHILFINILFIFIIILAIFSIINKELINIFKKNIKNA